MGRGDTEAMSGSAVASRTDGPIQIFVSYSTTDERWATWMAWELETAGYRAMLQAWDFVPGTNFIEFMDRGVSRSAAVVAVLSQRYVDSPYGRLEWQAALQADKGNPTGRLVTVRVEDCQVDGLLGIITYIDLVGVTDQHQARALLLDRIRHALAGRAERQEVAYPPAGQVSTGQVPVGQVPAGQVPRATAGSLSRPRRRLTRVFLIHRLVSNLMLAVRRWQHRRAGGLGSGLR